MRMVQSYDWSMSEPLNEPEKAFKALYTEYSSLEPDRPHNTEAFQEIFHRAAEMSGDSFPAMIYEDMLEEGDFFSFASDIELYRHVRYLPCNWHSHSFLEVLCVIEGTCTNYIAEQRQELREGDIVIVAPNTKHAVSAFSDDAILYNILIRTSTFETAFFDILNDDHVLSRFFKRMLYQAKSAPYLLFHAGKDQQLFNFVGYAFEEYRGNSLYKRKMLNSIVNAFFIILLRNHGTEVIVPELAALDRNQNVVALLLYLQENYLTTTLADMAVQFSYSERHLQRLITEATGMSFSANIFRLKMSRAEYLLTSTDQPIADIAESLGYLDVRNFRESFKKTFGATPSEYRANRSSGGQAP